MNQKPIDRLKAFFWDNSSSINERIRSYLCSIQILHHILVRHSLYKVKLDVLLCRVLPYLQKSGVRNHRIGRSPYRYRPTVFFLSSRFMTVTVTGRRPGRFQGDPWRSFASRSAKKVATELLYAIYPCPHFLSALKRKLWRSFSFISCSNYGIWHSSL
jgi:hypothetical protein